MAKIGDIIEKDYFDKKLYYKVISQGEDGYAVTELMVGYVPTNTAEDLIEAVKEMKKSEPIKVVKKTSTKKK